MKELSIEEKAKAYDKVLERAKDYQKVNGPAGSAVVSEIFPELAESEDERIRKWCISHFKAAFRVTKDNAEYQEYLNKKVIPWLEKLGETFTKKDVDDAYLKGVCDAKQELEKQDKYTEINRGKNYLCTKTHKYAGEEWREGIKYFAAEDYTLINQGCAYYCPSWSKEEHNNFFKEVGYAEISPRFKVDDWITDGEYIWKIIDIRQLDYILQSQDGKVVDDTISYVDEHFHLWTIKDAKDGEVLVDDIDGRPFIFKGLSDPNHPNSPVAYCGINSECDFRVSYGSYRWTDKDVKPSTKEQRDRLFQKMKKAGSKWDSQNKRLEDI